MKSMIILPVILFVLFATTSVHAQEATPTPTLTPTPSPTAAPTDTPAATPTSKPTVAPTATASVAATPKVGGDKKQVLGSATKLGNTGVEREIAKWGIALVVGAAAVFVGIKIAKTPHAED